MLDSYNEDQTCAMALADFEALDLDPTLPESSGLIDLSAADLRALLPLASADETRYNLNGILVEVDAVGRTLTMVATDGHCLGRIVRPCTANADASFILSRDAITKALALSGRGKRALPVLLEMSVSGRYSACALLVGQARITDVEVSGQYPDYRQVIADDDPGRIEDMVKLTIGRVKAAARNMAPDVACIGTTTEPGAAAAE